MKRLFLLLALLPVFSFCREYSFTGAGGPIPDSGKVTYFSVQAIGLPKVIDDNFGVERVCINIQHDWDKDLEIFLAAPDGSVVNLSLRNGGEDDNYTRTCFSDTSSRSIDFGPAPFMGVFRPETPLGCVNNGQNPNGVWQLIILDNYPGEGTGSLVSWTLTFSEKACKRYKFTTSNLPILLLKSGGKPILNEPKTTLRMGIIDNGPGKINSVTDPWNAFDGFVDIESRGNSTQRMPKLGYSLELVDSAGKDYKAEILGMPKDADWVLQANYADKSLVRNAVAYSLYEAMGHYAPRMRFVNLVVDGQYRGVYQIGEKLEKGEERIDVSKLDPDDNAGDSLTGGYIIKTDWRKGTQTEGWESKYTPMKNDDKQFWQYHYPIAKKMSQQQKDYIAAFVDSMETACIQMDADTSKGYPHYIDVNTFIDVLIMAELGKNVDGLWMSSYYVKQRGSKGGRLQAGPIWDYDLSFGNFEHYDGYSPAGWHIEEYSITYDKIPQFWYYLWKSPYFQNRLKCRWIELRKTTLSIENIHSVIDQQVALVMESQQHNFKVWPILGTYVWPNPKPYEKDYEGEVRRLKEWFVMRLAWMDAFMPGQCN